MHSIEMLSLIYLNGTTEQFQVEVESKVLSLNLNLCFQFHLSEYCLAALNSVRKRERETAPAKHIYHIFSFFSNGFFSLLLYSFFSKLCYCWTSCGLRYLYQNAIDFSVFIWECVFMKSRIKMRPHSLFFAVSLHMAIASSFFCCWYSRSCSLSSRYLVSLHICGRYIHNIQAFCFRNR